MAKPKKPAKWQNQISTIAPRYVFVAQLDDKGRPITDFLLLEDLRRRVHATHVEFSGSFESQGKDSQTDSCRFLFSFSPKCSTPTIMEHLDLVMSASQIPVPADLQYILEAPLWASAQVQVLDPAARQCFPAKSTCQTECQALIDWFIISIQKKSKLCKLWEQIWRAEHQKHALC